MKKRSFWRDNGLSLTVLGIFLLFVGGQTLTGWNDHNNDQKLHHKAPDSLSSYAVSGDFYEALFENWESEFLQMGAYIVLTTFLFQRGSSESKDPDKPSDVDEKPEEKKDDPDAPGPVRAGGWKLALYKHSLSAAFSILFFVSFIGHAIGGAHAYSDELRSFGQAPVSTLQYLGSARFWFESLQNWQSEFLAVFCIVVLSIKLREQGSPESKPVAAPHSQTGDG
ncbi:hypothetical protein B1R32_107135 [Abditibacterium utsteinense]|uniref:Transmembrane protein n=1 Tax=Abditibacterium utsteinense TaxID=1960156 RepID=A0A2S8STI9_9BACT|nr:DUF6766 family protein [Abditibacterium utsteinense]PQV64110.1 hypothetical protein B1R32_107135 [Abditibacterium utsteinense]